METKRAQFSNNLGFILAAVGGAVGMGNLWRFPYYAGKFGGSIFILIYLVIVALFGFSLILAEISIGRSGRKDGAKSFAVIAGREGRKNPQKWGYMGIITILTALTCFGYYNVVGGWVIHYLLDSLYLPLTNMNLEGFQTITTSMASHLTLTLVCLLLVTGIILGGVQKGIERANKVLLPALTVMLIVIAIRSVTLPGAAEGLAFLFKPNWAHVVAAGGLGVVALKALGASFASLSIGYGAYITFGSYLSQDENILKGAVAVPILDTLVALLASVAIMPIVFATGMEPGTGPGLMFGTLPLAFAELGSFGRLFCCMFFLMALFAALTSIVSLMEVGVCYLGDTWNMTRPKACALLCLLMTVVSGLCVLSFGPMADMTFFGMSFFDFWCALADTYVLPTSALFIAIFVGWVWTPEKALKEITNNNTLAFPVFAIWKFLIKYLAPVCIVIVFVMSLMHF